jgi:hypothetical protein
MQEIWKDIKGYEGKYQVSNKGNVKSLNFNNTGKPKELKQKINRYGYYEVKLSKNNKTKNFLVSTLVANAFLNRKNNEVEVMHIGDTSENNVENLRFGYRCEIIFNTYKRYKREGTPTKYKISYDKKRYATLSDMARAYNIKPDQLHKRLERGWTLNEALSIPIQKENAGGRPLFYKYYGKDMTLEQISKITGIKKEVIQKRIGRGWDIYSASEIPVSRKGGTKKDEIRK